MHNANNTYSQPDRTTDWELNNGILVSGTLTMPVAMIFSVTVKKRRKNTATAVNMHEKKEENEHE